MNKYFVLSLLLALAAPAVNAQSREDKIECKLYKFCCDNDVCSNNCHMRPACDFRYPKVGSAVRGDLAVRICENYFEYECCREASCAGDPHFQTWSGDVFDFHGECDLNFVHAPSFGHGLGLDVQIRTRIKGDYSIIESAAIKIGNGDVLEVGSWGQWFINGVTPPAVDGRAGTTAILGYLSSFAIEYEKLSKHSHKFTISTGEHQAIVIKTFKALVSVKFDNALPADFVDSSGILGDFLTGKRLARDGISVIEDPNQFGQEWQVTKDEPMLFSFAREPQLANGQKCIMPELTVDGDRRRLSEYKVSEEDATAACADWQDEFKKSCIYDVMATGDLELAEAGAY